MVYITINNTIIILVALYVLVSGFFVVACDVILYWTPSVVLHCSVVGGNAVCPNLTSHPNP